VAAATIILRDQDAGQRRRLNQRGRYIVVEVGDRGDRRLATRAGSLSEILAGTPASAVVAV